ncbi:MAG: hypothetical protein MOGMAGMI_01568 [Candidatus Omnitrophica bacterium]|nr:hypothetical protein [Candidatus Omnitrophota bacterium]
MFDLLIFVALPYVALLSLVVGSWVRYRTHAFSYSSLSTQFLEDRWLLWASAPWHAGIIVVLLGHLAAFAVPGWWTAFMATPAFLTVVESVGLLCGWMCLGGLVIFLVRRFVNARLQAVTTLADVLVVLVLMAQVGTGLAVAVNHRWGAAWAPGALGPYLHGVLTLRPDVSVLTDMPPFVKLHIASAWVLLAMFPFTRLVHVLSLPLRYITRAPQRVVWTSSRASVRFEERAATDNERRLFLRAALSAGAGVALLSMGTLDKFFKYFLKQDLTEDEQAHLLSAKLRRLKQTAEERELELERMSRDAILVAPMAELSTTRGKYFIDYQMRPALAFKDAEGLPIVISAKCTHLGCTVGQDVDAQGRILCPCHVSYFDIKTGQPNLGAPAKEALPRLGWALKDGNGKVLLVQDPSGGREGSAEPGQLATSLLYILKRYA